MNLDSNSSVSRLFTVDMSHILSNLQEQIMHEDQVIKTLCEEVANHVNAYTCLYKQQGASFQGIKDGHTKPGQTKAVPHGSMKRVNKRPRIYHRKPMQGKQGQCQRPNFNKARQGHQGTQNRFKHGPACPRCSKWHQSRECRVDCYRCGMPGHFARNCYHKQEMQQQQGQPASDNENQSLREDEVMEE